MARNSRDTVGLGEVVAVALGGVDQVHAKLPSPSQELVDLMLRKRRLHSPPSCRSQPR